MSPELDETSPASPGAKTDINTDPTVKTLANGEVEKGNPKEFLGDALLGFLDILGFSQAVQENWADGPESALCKLLRIKGQIPQENTQVAFALYSRDDMTDRITYNCRIQTVSDSVVVSVAIPSRCKPAEFLIAFFALYSNVWQIWRRSILEGFTIRGGVEVGGVYWDARDVTGPVLVDALNLEKRVACWSRVIVGVRFIKHLLKISRTVDFAKHMLSPLWALNRDEDGEISISPRALIGPNMGDAFGVIPKLAALQEKCTDQDARGKYDSLLSLLRNPSRIRSPELEDLQSRARM